MPFALFFPLLFILRTSAQCVALGGACTNYTDCCDATGNGATCNLKGPLYTAAQTCAQCPPVAHACRVDVDCCYGAPYGFKGWCRYDTAPYSSIQWCETCQPDGGICGPPSLFPGFSPSACCARAGQLCNTTGSVWHCQ